MFYYNQVKTRAGARVYAHSRAQCGLPVRGTGIALRRCPFASRPGILSRLATAGRKRATFDPLNLAPLSWFCAPLGRFSYTTNRASRALFELSTLLRVSIRVFAYGACLESRRKAPYALSSLVLELCCNIRIRK